MAVRTASGVTVVATTALLTMDTAMVAGIMAMPTSVDVSVVEMAVRPDVQIGIEVTA